VGDDSLGDKERFHIIKFIVEPINSGNDRLICSSSLALSRSVLSYVVQPILEYELWEVLMVVLEHNQPFGMKERVFTAMPAIVKNTIVQQASAIVEYGFFNIVEAHLGLVEALPKKALRARFHLAEIAVSRPFSE
jgi:hypothetical protein